MRVQLNGAWRELSDSSAPAELATAPAPPTLASLLVACGYGGAVVATAVNGEFVPARARRELCLREGDRIEVLAPMQGG